MDQTIINIISTVLGIASLFIVITGYNVPELRRSFYGGNIFAEKRNIIENTMTAIFTWVAFLSFWGLIINDVYGGSIPERLHNSGGYWAIFGLISLITLLIILVLTFWGKKIAKRKWMPIGIEAYGKENSAFPALKNMDFSKAPERAKSHLEIMENRC